MSNIQTSAGTVFYVSAAEPATYDEIGFDALTWTIVGEVTNLGSVGPNYELVTYDPLGNRVTKKLKGQVNMGSQSVELGRKLDDAGQVILKSAVTIDSATEDSIHSFRIDYKDGDQQFYTGLPMSYASNVGAANDIVSASVAIEIDNKVIEVTA